MHISQKRDDINLVQAEFVVFGTYFLAVLNKNDDFDVYYNKIKTYIPT